MSECSNVIELKQIINIDDISLEFIDRVEEQMKKENFQGSLEDFIVKIIDFGMKPENRESVRRRIDQIRQERLSQMN